MEFVIGMKLEFGLHERLNFNLVKIQKDESIKISPP